MRQAGGASRRISRELARIKNREKYTPMKTSSKSPVDWKAKAKAFKDKQSKPEQIWKPAMKPDIPATGWKPSLPNVFESPALMVTRSKPKKTLGWRNKIRKSGYSRFMNI